ncbi:MAG TPA: cytidine deaminase [Clostridia bacterium]
MNENELVKSAFTAKLNSYSPYSRFRVGAAALAASGKIYTGCNIENASYGATICAERTAVFNAVSSGENKITAVAIASDSDDFILPCGICRQVLAEFGDKDMKIICTRPDGKYRVYTLDELLPEAFSKINIKGD